MEYYGLREVAEMTGMKVRTVREWLKKGKLKAVKLGNDRAWSVELEEIERIRGIMYENECGKHTARTEGCE